MNKALTVEDFIRICRDCLNESFGGILVEGKVTEINYHAKSGNVYFTLNHKASYLKCVIWQFRKLNYKETLEVGSKVVIYTKPSIIKSGQFLADTLSINISSDESKENEKKKLEEKLKKEGLLDLDKKRISAYPKHLIIITSLDGVVQYDILESLKNAYPTKVTILDSSVQGDSAVSSLVKSINYANQNYQNATAIVLARGGGSSEDFSAFDNEAVVRAIIDSKLAVITALGHYVDQSLADKVADKTVPTPTAVASLFHTRSYLLNAVIRHCDVILENTNNKLNKYNNKIQYLASDANRYNYLLRKIKRQILEVRQIFNGMQPPVVSKVQQTQKVLNILDLKFESNSYQRILSKGFTMILDDELNILKDSKQVSKGNSYKLVFKDQTVDVVVK